MPQTKSLETSCFLYSTSYFEIKMWHITYLTVLYATYIHFHGPNSRFLTIIFYSFLCITSYKTIIYNLPYALKHKVSLQYNASALIIRQKKGAIKSLLLLISKTKQSLTTKSNHLLYDKEAYLAAKRIIRLANFSKSFAMPYLSAITK